MAEKNVKFNFVKGVSKKNNFPYYACEICFPTIAGTELKKMVFFRDVEMQLIGLKPEQFQDK